MQSEVEKYRYDQVYTFICFRVRLLLISGSEKIVFKCFSKRLKDIYYVKSGPVWSVFGPFFPAFSVNTSVLVRMQENKDQKKNRKWTIFTHGYSDSQKKFCEYTFNKADG